jgi:peptidoglycan/LPS O-acetylase OafA/YrhL
VRLLPIYFAAVGFGWLAQPGPALTDLAGNFAFLQNAAPDNPFHVQLLEGNANLWSLHYEVIYYLGFMLVWWLRLPLRPLLLVLLLTGALGALLPGFSLWSAWLACGAILWLLGLYVAWHLPADATAGGGPWPSALLLCLATWRLQIFHAALTWLGHPVTWLPGITFNYLDALPVLLWIFLLLTRRRPVWLHLLELVAWTLPVAYVVWRNRNGLLPWNDPVMLAAAMILGALALRGWSPMLGAFERLAPLGAISYGLYAFGAPAQFFIRSLWPDWSGTAWTYGGRCLLALILVFALAWLFERRLQPWFRRRLGPHRPHPASPAVWRTSQP